MKERNTGAAGRARPVAGHDPAARAVAMRPHDSRGTDPVDAGLHVTITTCAGSRRHPAEKQHG